MLIEALRGKVVITVNDIHHDRPPGDDVSVLCLFVETDKAADDIGTETGANRSVTLRRSGDIQQNLRNEGGFGFSAAALSLLTLIMVHAEQNMYVGGSTAALLFEQVGRLLHEALAPKLHAQFLVLVELLGELITLLQ